MVKPEAIVGRAAVVSLALNQPPVVRRGAVLALGQHVLLARALALLQRLEDVAGLVVAAELEGLALSRVGVEEEAVLEPCALFRASIL